MFNVKLNVTFFLQKDAINGLKYLFDAKELVNKLRSDVPNILPLKEKVIKKLDFFKVQYEK